MSNTENLRDTLLVKRTNGYDRVSGAEAAQLNEYCEGYKVFLNRAKTEREAAEAAEVMAKTAGFVPFERGMKLNPGDRVYSMNHGRAIALAVIGSEPLSEGALITAAHIDSPRLDLKPYPLYEESDMAFFKTHYYGGIRKYQWVTVPLELHGIVVKKDGTTVTVNLGGRDDEPAFVITDLLPHLSKDQNTKPLSTAFTGENLNVLVGGVPYNDDGSDKVKLAVMSLLNDRYGICEEDFLSAELSLVPAGKSRDIGFDASFVGAYGQDDRVCAYTTLTALLEIKETPKQTCVCILADKEEIGSEGVSGMQSEWYDTFLDNLCKAANVDLRVCFEHSLCLSADVGAAYDPNFAEVYDKRNSALVNGGAILMKYTGAGGKSSSNDAMPEVIAKIRKTFDEANVIWQMGELGKVDQGGGGTVAKYMASRNIDTVDIGVPVLSMHAPFEVTAKLDVYMMYRAAKAFFALEK